MKKFLSVLLVFALSITVFIPAISAVEADERVFIEASSMNPITIEEQATIPSDDDYNGILEVTAGEYNIQRDYSQSAMITVKNTSDLSVEYYLTVLNVYDDIYLNFVRSGSSEIPLVIAAGETQEIQLDIFAQNTTRANYEFPIYAHVVTEDNESVDAKATAFVNCPVVNLNVSLTKISDDPNTLAQVYSLRNNGSAVSDMTVSLAGELYDYVMLTPLNENVYMSRGETIEFTAIPDLAKMKVNNVQRIEGQIVVSSGGATYVCDAVFDTKGQKISTITVGELVALQMNGFSTEGLSTKKTDMGTIKIPSNDEQCTNAGKVTTKVRAPLVNGISTQSLDSSTVRVFLTSRMYGGSYVNKADTNYDYYVNGVKVATSHNTGLTEVSIVELPTDNFKFGAMNTIVRDYDTNPGSHFVTANTEISILIPGETPICYIGSPETLPDYRSLPDFAVYTENIYSAKDDVIIGNEDEININIYNRGSEEGTFNIEVSDKDGVIYSEENHYLDAFSGDKISFKWMPEYESEKVTVTITNTTAGIPEEELSNNVAEKVFSTRKRVTPVIESITPDYGVAGESVVYATVRDYLDVTKVDFYVDDQLYTGEVKSSPYGGSMRYWINDESMAVGSHKIKVVVTYANTSTTTATVEKSIDFNVFNNDWNHHKFNLDENVGYASFYVCDDYYNKYVNVIRNGAECTYLMTKEEYDNKEDYSIIAVSDNAVLFKSLSENKDLSLDDCNQLTFVHDNIDINGIYLRSVNENNLYRWLNAEESLNLMPAKYQFSVSASCMGYYKDINVEVDLTAGDVVVDLSDYFDIFSFDFADAVEGYPSVGLFYQNSEGGAWNTIALETIYTGNAVVAVIADAYDCSVLHNAENAFVMAVTDDVLFVEDINAADGCVSKEFTVSKSALQEYVLLAGEDDSEISSVEVKTNRFSAWLFDSTIYVSPDEYEITVYCNDLDALDYLTTESLGISYVEVQAADKSSVAVNIGSAYERYAKVYGNGVMGADISVENYLSGTEIEADKDSYNLTINLNRNESTYTVQAVADATDGSAVVSVGNHFNGDIINSFETYSAYSQLRIYLDNLKDENGNELVAFSSKDEENKLTGQLVLTNVDDETDVKRVWVELDNASYADVILPDAPGTYNVALIVSTDAELMDLEGLTLSESEISLVCGSSYQLTAGSVPEDIALINLVWTSSDESIAVVDENGVVTADKNNEGTVVITVSTEDGLYSASCVVKVETSIFQRIINFLLTFFRSLFELFC